MKAPGVGRGLAVGLAILLAAGSVASGQQKGAIPSHPRELKYAPLDYVPPNASAYRHVLSNGVAGYFVEDHDLPLTNISLTIRVGSYLDPKGKEGLASAVGSQIRSGGTSTYKAEQFDEEADFLAANLSSGIGGTQGWASVNFLSKDADKALELFFDMLRNPAFQQDRLDLFKSQVLQQIERRNDRTDDIEAREWNRLLRGDDHFTTVPSTKASIGSLTRDDLIAFHRKYYHPGNFIVAVSGDFKADDMKARLEKGLAGWTSSGEKVTEVPKPDFVPAPGVYMVNKADANQARVSIGHLGIVRGNPDEFALDLMNDILGGSGFTSRITNRVRSDEGLAYSAGSSFASGVYYPGQFRASFQSKSSTAAQAAQIVLDEINRMRTEKASEEELETVKNNAIEVFPRFFASSAAIAGTFAADEFTGRDPRYWETYRDKLRAVTVADVQRVARKYLEPEKLVVLAVGNVEDVLKGDPEKPEYSFQKIAAGKPIRHIPLPDPNTMIYPSGN
jgi:predicted Zn-dependent peptidase